MRAVVLPAAGLFEANPSANIAEVVPVIYWHRRWHMGFQLVGITGLNRSPSQRCVPSASALRAGHKRASSRPLRILFAFTNRLDLRRADSHRGRWTWLWPPHHRELWSADATFQQVGCSWKPLDNVTAE